MAPVLHTYFREYFLYPNSYFYIWKNLQEYFVSTFILSYFYVVEFSSKRLIQIYVYISNLKKYFVPKDIFKLLHMVNFLIHMYTHRFFLMYIFCTHLYILHKLYINAHKKQNCCTHNYTCILFNTVEFFGLMQIHYFIPVYAHSYFHTFSLTFKYI